MFQVQDLNLDPSQKGTHIRATRDERQNEREQPVVERREARDHPGTVYVNQDTSAWRKPAHPRPIAMRRSLLLLVAATSLFLLHSINPAATTCSAFLVPERPRRNPHSHRSSGASSNNNKNELQQPQAEERWPMMMVRNIDLPEALILYGRHVLCDPVDDKVPRVGLVELVQECHDVDTAVVVLLDSPVRRQQEDPQQCVDDSQQQLQDPSSSSSSTSIDNDETAARAWVEALLLPPNKKKKTTTAPPIITVLHATAPPPNARDLLRARKVVARRNAPLARSSGFGAGPRRSLVAFAAAVALRISTVASGDRGSMSRAARACGPMRVVSIFDGNEDDPLADAVVDEVIDCRSTRRTGGTTRETRWIHYELSRNWYHSNSNKDFAGEEEEGSIRSRRSM